MIPTLALWTALALAGDAEPVEPPPSEPVLVDTGAPPPWEAGNRPWVSPMDLEGLAAYRRYQRIAHAGIPLYVSGLALGTWSVWAFEVGRINGNQETFGLFGATALAGGGGAALAYGSFNAANRLYDGKPPPLGLAAGYLSYGLLGVSAAGMVTGGVSFFFFPPAALPPLGFAIGAAAFAGIPGLIQTAVNPALRRRWEARHSTVRVVPWIRREGPTGLQLVARF